ncbi:hypothetical protein H0H93_002039, partial [Arthromyces matolae]
PQAVSNPFPNLHTLACNGLSNDSWASPSWAPFVHPGLKHLVFKFWYASLPELVPFALPLVNMQGLSRFEITVDSNEAQVRNLVKTIHVIRDLPNLTTLVIPLYAATQDVLQAASELPVLEHLVSDQYGKEVDCRCVYFVIPTFAVGCFPVLTSLTIVGCVTELLTIVQHPHFPINIIALRVYRTYCPQNANNLMGFHEFVAQHCRNLTEYAVTSLFPIVFSFRQLLPLASLQIVDLTVEALKFSQDELQELLTTLPNLKKLNLNPPPFHPKPGSNAGLTMDMIPVIASCCPRLQKLGIHIKDSNIGTSSSMEHIVVVPFNDGFSELHVGNSAPPIHIFFEIVEYLGLILPANSFSEMFRSAANKLAHNSTLPSLGGNNDLKPLQDLILAEKQVLTSLQKLSTDVAKAAEALRIWGSGEGDDLGDILGASSTLLALWASSVSQFSAHGHAMRDYLKAIRTREENLDELKRRRKSLGSKAETAEKKLSKMGPEHKNLTAQTDSLNALRAEIRVMDSDIMTEEAALGDFKRTTTKAWMGLKFGALLECSEKGTEIPEEKTQPGMARSLYYGRNKTEQLLAEAHRCMNEVVMSTVPTNPSPQFAQPQPNFQPDVGAGTPQLHINSPQSTFQVPGMYDQASQGTQSHNEYGEWQRQVQPSGDQQFLPPTLGTGQFLEQPGSPGSFNPQSYGGQPGQPIASYHTGESNVPPRSVDDFGVNSTTSSGIGNADYGNSGRFATFPVKNQNRGYPLADPSLAGSESFSASVHQSLSPPQSPPGTAQQQTFPHEVYNQGPRQSHDAVPAGHLSLQHDPRISQYSDAGLAYDEPREDDTPRHVRFGGSSDVNEQAAGHVVDSNGQAHPDSNGQAHPEHEQQQIHEPQEPEAQAAPVSTSDAQPPQYEAIPPVAEATRETKLITVPPSGHSLDLPPQTDIPSGNRSPASDTRFQTQRRVPPPVFDPAEDERMLNAAAAREVIREMNSIPPVAQNTSGYGTLPNISTNEALIPPVTSYNTAPSPNPDSPILPYPSHSTPPSTYSQPTQQSPYPDQQQARRPSYDSASRRSNDEPPRLPPIATQASSPYSTPYSAPAPGEYPRGIGAFPTKSSSSLNPVQGPPGARTISAAAFKRPQRMASGDVQSAGDVSPLSISKKRLPNSPYPPARDSSPGRRSRSGSPAPPAPAPSQALPPVPTEEEYDYLSAYVDTGLPEHEAADPGQRGRRVGYVEGRYSTNLDDGLR